MAFREIKSYFELYAHTARDLTSTTGLARVGWACLQRRRARVPEFLQYAARAIAVPVDFVTTHGYADDTAEDLFGAKEDVPMDERVLQEL